MLLLDAFTVLVSVTLMYSCEQSQYYYLSAVVSAISLCPISFTVEPVFDHLYSSPYMVTEKQVLL